MPIFFPETKKNIPQKNFRAGFSEFKPNQKFKNKKNVLVVNTWRCFHWQREEERKLRQLKEEKDAE
jgi:hypothetical protein